MPPRAIEPLLAASFARLQAGDVAGAAAILRSVERSHAGDPRLSLLLGQIAQQGGRSADAVRHLTAALNAAPDNVQVRTKLGFALLETGDLDRLEAVVHGQHAVPLRRLHAHLMDLRGHEDEAIVQYREVLREVPGDHESWGNLGRAELRRGRLEEALFALRQAVLLQPEESDYILGLSQALAKAGRNEERRALLESAIAQAPARVDLLVQLGLAEGAIGAFAAAERAFGQALAANPRAGAVYLEYGMLLERLNRIDDLVALVARARDHSISGAEIDFIDAWANHRQGRWRRALELAHGVTQRVNPARRAQLIGEASDRLAESREAFGAFEQMNRIDSEEPAHRAALAIDFEGEIQAKLDRLRGRRPVMRRGAQAAKPFAPVFIVGFPRSGTTLLDTFLRNVATCVVIEEGPMLEEVEAAAARLGPIDAIGEDERAHLRAIYFGSVRRQIGGEPGERIIIDKYPMHLIRAELAFLLFPDAKWIFSERHPCDVVLSCFFSRFVPNKAMSRFLDLSQTANLYDLAFSAWSAAAAIFPLQVHQLRYERLIEDPERELRAALAFLELPWTEAVIDHQASAARREHVATASYAQISEPLHQRSVGRWRRYHDQLVTILPKLAPWAARMGYSLDIAES